jgi:hypothetical protein
LADVPYLADVARLDWRLAEAERACDAQVEPETLQRLSDTDPSQLWLRLMPGVAVLACDLPAVSIWKAHQPTEDAAEHRAAARRRLDQGQGEQAVVWRAGWRACADTVDLATARWMQALLNGESIDIAVERAGSDFAFEAWLVQALERQWLWRVTASEA